MRARRKKGFLIGSGVFLFLFLMLIFFMSGVQGQLLDEQVAYWAANKDSGVIGKLMEYASFLGSSELVLLVTVIIGIVLLVMLKWRQLFFFFVLSVGGVFLNLALKLLIHRERPGDEAKYIDVFNYQLELQSYSFPSGHTMRATIFFLFLIYLVYYFGKRTLTKWILFVLFSVLTIAVPLSRVILDAHFATDVIGAVFISFAWFFLCLYFFHKPKETGISFSF